MKKLLVIGVATATIAAGMLYLIYKLKEDGDADVVLDFYEHALGGI